MIDIEMADVAGENEADSGSGVPSTVAEGSGTPDDDLERNDSDRVTGSLILFDISTSVLIFILLHFLAIYF